MHVVALGSGGGRWRGGGGIGAPVHLESEPDGRPLVQSLDWRPPAKVSIDGQTPSSTTTTTTTTPYDDVKRRQ